MLNGDDDIDDGMKQYILIYNSRSFRFEKNKDDGEAKMDS